MLCFFVRYGKSIQDPGAAGPRINLVNLEQAGLTEYKDVELYGSYSVFIEKTLYECMSECINQTRCIAFTFTLEERFTDSSGRLENCWLYEAGRQYFAVRSANWSTYFKNQSERIISLVAFKPGQLFTKFESFYDSITANEYCIYKSWKKCWLRCQESNICRAITISKISGTCYLYSKSFLGELKSNESFYTVIYDGEKGKQININISDHLQISHNISASIVIFTQKFTSDSTINLFRFYDFLLRYELFRKQLARLNENVWVYQSERLSNDMNIFLFFTSSYFPNIAKHDELFSNETSQFDHCIEKLKECLRLNETVYFFIAHLAIAETWMLVIRQLNESYTPSGNITDELKKWMVRNPFFHENIVDFLQQYVILSADLDLEYAKVVYMNFSTIIVGIFNSIL